MMRLILIKFICQLHPFLKETCAQYVQGKELLPDDVPLNLLHKEKPLSV